MRSRSMIVTCLVVALAFVACGEQAGTYDEKPSAAPPDTASVEVTPAMEATLASADGVDGEKDHVVANCPGCGLAMEGSGDHALKVGEYSLHFCSDRCRGDFSKDLEASIVALAVPEAEGAEPAQEDATP